MTSEWRQLEGDFAADLERCARFTAAELESRSARRVLQNAVRRTLTLRRTWRPGAIETPAPVVLAASAKDDDGEDARTVLMGVYPQDLALSRVSSNASCTTNSAPPVIDVLRQHIGYGRRFSIPFTAIPRRRRLRTHRFAAEISDERRVAAANIVPAAPGAAIAVTRAIPSLRGRFDGVPLRVPVLTGSLSSIVALTERPTTVEEANAVLSRAAQDSRWSGVLATTKDPLASSDIVGDPHAAIIDLSLTKVMSLTKVIDSDLCAVYSWYDNEFGFANTLFAHVRKAAETLHAVA